MNTILFILAVMWICLGLCILKCSNSTLENRLTILWAILFIVGGCVEAGKALFC